MTKREAMEALKQADPQRAVCGRAYTWAVGVATMKIILTGLAYRTVMRIAHKFNWHYAPPVYPDGDTQLWCKWCGFRQTIKRRNSTPLSIGNQTRDD